MVDRGVADSGRHAAGLPEAFRGDVVIRRTPAGWRVEGSFPALPTDTVDDLGHALALADLLAESTVPGPRPPRPADGLDEVARLRASVRQLEHALASRVLVEQAIGVLTDRWHVAPRDAFEQLRRVTRSHGLRIHDLAKQVIESCTDPEVTLPVELVPAQRASGSGPPSPRQSQDGRGSTEPARSEPAERQGRERRTRREREGRRGTDRSGTEPAGGLRSPGARLPSAAVPTPAPVQHTPHGRHVRAER